eukprot:TRINITY_DN23368_c0_g1_i1.p1 TRINITY_DN23368_c0_g1~~TRINITY_DN23368_c0_g1_i1.p1  ORF type:complete len:354 (-),score=45.29 TRINITY_DN23368_c0_g1_i1:255-1316(-)
MSFGDAWGFLPSFQPIQSPTSNMEGDSGSILGTMALEGIINKSSAFAAIKSSRTADVDERRSIDVLGHYNADRVSHALEQAHADRCASRVAEDLGLDDDRMYFQKRADTAFKFWDPKQGIFAPLVREGPGQKEVFETIPNKLDAHERYTEGSALQYSFGAAFDVDQMIEKHGGELAFVRNLDYFFNEAPVPAGQIDMSGNHHGLSLGNEPTMHTPYLYIPAHQPSKTQALLDVLVKEMFSDKKDGLPGNDDMGAMSAWAAFNLLGFYPADPCFGMFLFGRPFIDQAHIVVSGGSLFIQVHNQTEDNKYVERIVFNGHDIDVSRPEISFQQLSKGGTLEIWMSAEAFGTNASGA